MSRATTSSSACRRPSHRVSSASVQGRRLLRVGSVADRPARALPRRGCFALDAAPRRGAPRYRLLHQFASRSGSRAANTFIGQQVLGRSAGDDESGAVLGRSSRVRFHRAARTAPPRRGAIARRVRCARRWSSPRRGSRPRLRRCARRRPWSCAPRPCGAIPSKQVSGSRMPAPVPAGGCCVGSPSFRGGCRSASRGRGVFYCAGSAAGITARSSISSRWSIRSNPCSTLRNCSSSRW